MLSAILPQAIHQALVKSEIHFFLIYPLPEFSGPVELFEYRKQILVFVNDLFSPF